MQLRLMWFAATALAAATGCSSGASSSPSGDAGAALGAPGSDAAGASVSDAAAGTANDAAPASASDAASASVPDASSVLHADAGAETGVAAEAGAASEAGASSEAGVAPEAGTHAQTFFVTRAAYSPAFDPNQTGFPAGADKLCIAAASAAGLAGNFVAWIWNPTLNKPTGVQPGLPKPGPWYATDGTTLLFPTQASLEGFPKAPITLDEYGQPVAAGETVWTGMDVGGQGGDTCCNWTAYCSLGSWLAVYGQTGTTGQAWIDAADGDCSGSTERHLYCIQAD
jgi:hypothetical protein